MGDSRSPCQCFGLLDTTQTPDRGDAVTLWTL